MPARIFQFCATWICIAGIACLALEFVDSLPYKCHCKARNAHAKKFSYDLKTIAADLKKRQKASGIQAVIFAQKNNCPAKNQNKKSGVEWIFLSRPMNPHPLFVGLVKAAKERGEELML